MTRLRSLIVACVLLAGASLVFAQAQPFNYWVPPSQCQSYVSGNSTGTNGLTVTGASNTPVVQAQTSITGSNTQTFKCNLAPPVSLTNTIGNRILIYDATFFYGPLVGLSAQAFTGSTGVFNGDIVFTLINYPTPGASETPSTVTPVRADSGTLAMTPVAASFNTSTTTAGSFYSMKFQPANPINWNTDLQQLILTVTFTGYGSLAQTLTSPGALIHIRSN